MIGRRWLRGSAAALVVACGSTAYEARANGRFPAASQLVSPAGRPEVLVLRTTFGILVSRDRGTSWDWVCERAVGYSGQEDPALAATSGGAILAGLIAGLAVSPDTGCGWSFAGGPLAGRAVVDVTARPGIPGGALALGAAFGDGGAVPRVYASADDGATWSAFGAPLDPSLWTSTIEATTSDPHRAYVTGVRSAVDAGGPAGAQLLVTSDDGAHWTEHPIPLEANETAAFVAAVDPARAGRVYVRTWGTKGRLLVTDDGGGTFREVFAGAPLLGFALSPDGARVWVGSPTDGLSMASSTDLVFSQRSSIHVQCLLSLSGKLYACSDEKSGFIVGASEDDGATFAPLLHLSTIRGPVGCSAGSAGAVCLEDWPALESAFGIVPPADAGLPDASVEAGPDAPDDATTEPVVEPPAPAPPEDGSSRSDCGCSLPGRANGASPGAGLTALLSAFVLCRLRRRSRFDV